jgi:hypothetical protein
MYVNGNAKTQTADECGGNNDRSCSKFNFFYESVMSKAREAIIYRNV